MSSSEFPITQVPERFSSIEHNQSRHLTYQQSEENNSTGVTGSAHDDDAEPPASRLKLLLRGVLVEVDHRTLVVLPESLLVTMFPNGLVLDKRRLAADEQVIPVDFDPACLKMVIDFFEKVREDHNEFSEEAYLAHAALAAVSGIPIDPIHYPLVTKSCIVFLREELDYFCLPQCKVDPNTMSSLKSAAGDYLCRRSRVFEAIAKIVAEQQQQLVDLLCDAGFSHESIWDYRSLEPGRTCIASLSLLHLKTVGPGHRMATAQRLLLFCWRRPARKCWWEGSVVDILGVKIRLWARRTWTLEMVLI